MILIKKRNGDLKPFDISKIEGALSKAFESCKWPKEKYVDVIKDIAKEVKIWDGISVEDIQDQVEELLMDYDFPQVAKEYILYRAKHNEARFIKERINYMNKYSNSLDNAASSSETDANSNVSSKNVANLEGEVYKVTNRAIQRQRMKDELNKLFPEVSKQYEKDLADHIIYVHDEASSPVLKYYCCAVTLYPLMLEGSGNMDMITPSAPNDIQSFSGQITNLAFLLSSQCKGAVAFGDYFIALNYYVVKEFGTKWYDKLDAIVSTDYCINRRTILDTIKKGMKQFIYGVNQPAGNRSYNSPFTNISYYDKYYFESLFKEFYYPDGSQPEWKAIDTLQRIFMKLHRDLRLIKPLTFPVSTIAMVYNDKDFLDKEYKELCAEEWAKGGSFFCYNSNNPTSLASCCRVLNEVSNNTFSSTTGMTGVMTGSCNVITLNINRIVQDWCRSIPSMTVAGLIPEKKHLVRDMLCTSPIWGFKDYLINILERVYKYHIAYKTMLYDLEDKGMFAASNAGYIYMSKLYSTIGIIGYTEAAQFLGLKVSNNQEYKEFLQLILGTIKEQNKLHSIHHKKRPFLFNEECVPGEGLGVKFYEADKEDGYYVPKEQNLYNCYFYNPWNNTFVLDKLKLHGKEISSYCDGGQACHINLDAHLSKEQYLKLLDVARKEGCNYFTFNIPMSECRDCGHTVNAPINECPKCNSTNIRYWTRIIGYLTAVDNWSSARQLEQKKRVYSDGRKEIN